MPPMIFRLPALAVALFCAMASQGQAADGSPKPRT